jgi:hypothetical protein
MHAAAMHVKAFSAKRSQQQACAALPLVPAGEQEGAGDLWQHHQVHFKLTTAAVAQQLVTCQPTVSSQSWLAE